MDSTQVANLLRSSAAWGLWAPILVALISVAGGVITWSVTEHARRSQEEFVRREARYAALLSALHGFYVDAPSPELRAEFIAELELAWLYCPDDVIRKGYRFLESVYVRSTADDDARELALGKFVVAIRRDLLSRRRVKATRLLPSDFLILTPTSPREKK